MSSKQDPNFEKKIAEEAKLGELANDMGLININAPTIRFPNETWEEIVKWCKRIELGQHVSLTNDRLFCIAYQFIHEEKEHPLPRAGIFGGNNKPWMRILYSDGSTKDLSKSEVPCVEAPDNITAATNSQLFIRALNNDMLPFVRLLASIYTAIITYVNVQSEDELSKPMVKELVGLFTGKIQGFALGRKITFSEFHKHYLSFMNDIVFLGVSHEVMEQESIILKNWLYKTREDGKPKVSEFSTPNNRNFMNMIKQDFISAKKQTSFFIEVHDSNYEDFSCNLINSLTEERLTIQSVPDHKWLIARMPRNCSDSPIEVFGNVIASLERSSNVHIDP